MSDDESRDPANTPFFAPPTEQWLPELARQREAVLDDRVQSMIDDEAAALTGAPGVTDADARASDALRIGDEAGLGMFGQPRQYSTEDQILAALARSERMWAQQRRFNIAVIVGWGALLVAVGAHLWP